MPARSDSERRGAGKNPRGEHPKSESAPDGQPRPPQASRSRRGPTSGAEATTEEPGGRPRRRAEPGGAGGPGRARSARARRATERGRKAGSGGTGRGPGGPARAGIERAKRAEKRGPHKGPSNRSGGEPTGEKPAPNSAGAGAVPRNEAERAERARKKGTEWMVTRGVPRHPPRWSLVIGQNLVDKCSYWCYFILTRIYGNRRE